MKRILFIFFISFLAVASYNNLQGQSCEFQNHNCCETGDLDTYTAYLPCYDWRFRRKTRPDKDPRPYQATIFNATPNDLACYVSSIATNTPIFAKVKSYDYRYNTIDDFGCSQVDYAISVTFDICNTLTIGGTTVTCFVFDAEIIEEDIPLQLNDGYPGWGCWECCPLF